MDDADYKVLFSSLFSPLFPFQGRCWPHHIWTRPSLWTMPWRGIKGGLGIAPHSSTLAWKILWTEEPGRLQSTGSLGVGHDWVTSLSLFTFMHQRRKWQPTPVFLPGKSQGQRSLVGCCLWGRTDSDTTDATCQQQDTMEMRLHFLVISGQFPNKCKLLLFKISY